MTTHTGTLFLLPTPLADGTALDVLPPATLTVARRVSYFLAEDAKTARAFLKAVAHPRPLQELRVVEIGHQPDPAAVDTWLQPVFEGLDAAIVAEAGCPGVADPGALVVARAHERGLCVRPLVGPSSLLLALMASGLNGQAFRFVGYLPQDAVALAARLAELERDARRGETQMWIETPYRNDRMLDAVLAHCAADTVLTLATDLTSVSESVQSRSIRAWRAIVASARPTRHKRPTVFALQAATRAKRPRR
jgi:16S rRNA (cytidine1402-2'-O)-methyltransferase